MYTMYFRFIIFLSAEQLTFASTVSMDERLVYSPDPNNSENTVLRQETIITVKGVPLTSYMENYLLNSISNNSFKVGGDSIGGGVLESCVLVTIVGHNNEKYISITSKYITKTLSAIIDDWWNVYCPMTNGLINSVFDTIGNVLVF